MNPTSQRDARTAAGANASASVTPDLKTNSAGMVKTGDGTYVNRDFISQSGLNAARQASGVTAPTIPATAIGSTSPVSLPPKPVSTAAEGLSGMASSVASAATAPQAPAPKPFSQAGLERSASDLGAEVAQQREGIKGAISKIAGIQAGRQSEEEEAGLPGKVERVNDVTNRLEASQRAQTNELRALDQSGLTDAQRDQRTKEINKQYAFEQADLALQQSAANRDYLTAKTILDRKMELQLEPLKTALEYDKFFYEENSDLFTKAEDRAFLNMMKESDRAYNDAKERLQKVNDAKIEAMKNARDSGAPESVLDAIQSADSVERVIRAAGAYGTDLKRSLEIKKLEAEIAEKTGLAVQNSHAVNALATVTAGLPENQRKAFATSMSTGIANADVNTVERTLRNAAKAFAGTGSSGEITKRDQAIDALKDLKAALTAYEASGKSTGFVKGGYEDIARKVGSTTDKNLAALETKIRLAVQAYRSAVSGAAFSESELKEYNAVFPSKKNGFELNSTIADTLLQSFENNNSSFYKSYYGDLPSNIAKRAILDELMRNATPEQIEQAANQ